MHETLLVKIGQGVEDWGEHLVGLAGRKVAAPE